MDKKPLTVSEAGKTGGTKTAERHGKEFYNKISRGGVAARERNRKSGSKSKPKSTDGEMTVREAGKRGGGKTAATHSHEFYQEIGRKGGLKIAAEHDREFFRELGKKSGIMRAKQREGSKDAEGKVAPIQERNIKSGSNPKPKSADSIMTVAEAGVKGGRKTAATHGHEFYQEIGRKGGQKVVAEHGPNFFKEIGKQGGQKVKRLIELGKKQKKE